MENKGFLQTICRIGTRPWTLWCMGAATLVWLVAGAVMCVDLADDGMMLSACQWFGEDPSAALCGSGYPLTCYVGWLLDGLHPTAGILAMRLWGVLFLLLMGVAAFFWLRRYFSPHWVALGLMLQLIYMSADSRLFGYNTLTALFGVVSLILVVEGSLRRQWWLILVGGMLSGLGIFVRLPNVVFASYAVLPFFLGKDSSGRWFVWQRLCLSAVFLLGFAAGGWAGWQWMVAVGAAPLVTNFLGSVGGELESDSTHNMFTMLETYARNYWKCVPSLFFFAVAALLAAWAAHSRVAVWLKVVLLVVASQVIHRSCYIAADGFGDRMIALMNGIGFVGAAWYACKGERRRMMSFGAVLFSVLCPAGSDKGFQVVWIGALLSLPIGLGAVWNMLADSRLTSWLRDKLSTTELRTGYLFGVFYLSLLVFIFVEHKPFFDPYNRWERVYPITSVRAGGVLTTKKKAELFNPLMAELQKYVREGETMLVYDFSPIIYYLTRTKPFAGISWPCMYVGQRYVKAFNQAEAEAERLPVVVMQQFYSTYVISDVERDYQAHHLNRSFVTPQMNDMVSSFLGRNHYRQVWSNGYYTIYLPSRR